MSFFEQFLLYPQGFGSLEWQPVEKLVEAFVKEVTEAADIADTSKDTIRLLRPLNLYIAKDEHAMHLVFSNKGAILGQTGCFYDELPSSPHISSDEAVKTAIKDIGFPLEDTHFVSLPSKILTMSAGERDELLRNFAQQYIEQELEEKERIGNTVRINPIFKGRDITVEKGLCFVLMPFNPSLEPIYEDHIRNVIEQKCGMKCLRADEITSNREIIEDIWESICKAIIIIADLTNRNPNVFYEVGICHTVGKDVILITQSLDDVPFDLGHIRVIHYQCTPTGYKEFEGKLHETVKAILRKVS